MVRWLTTLGLVLVLALAPAACGDNRDGGATSLAIDPEAATVPAGRDLALTARYLRDDGSAAPGGELAWTSSDPAIATVTGAADGAAVVHGVAQGSVVITASAGALDDFALITVRAPELVSIAVDPPSVTLPRGTCTTLHAIATTSDGVEAPVPANELFWSGRNGRVSFDFDGTICGVVLGEDVITAHHGDLTADATVEVVDPIAVGLVLAGPFAVVRGTTAQGFAIALLSDGSEDDVTLAATWTIDDSAIATVSSSGVVTGVTEGQTMMHASFGAFSDSDPITVFPVPLRAIEVTPDAPFLVAGASIPLTATAVFDDGSRLDVTGDATWWSGSPTIATVSAGGLLTAVAPGASVVSAQLDFVTGSVFVSVGF